MKIYKVRKNKGVICNNILHALPDWFGIEKSIKNYINNVVDMPMLACMDRNKIVGFLSLKIHNAYTAEIFVIGIIKEYQRKGIGKEFLKEVEKYLQNKKIEFLIVKTLSGSHPDKFYKRTRLFYTHCGFKPIEDFGSKIWGKENPCLLMLKQINKL